MELNWGMKHAAYMLITPQIAAMWLQVRNNVNRAQRPTVVEQYSRDMQGGGWMDSGDAITFDYNGELINGQHRLEAILASGISQSFIVATGLNPQTRSVVDIHAKRSTRDAFDGAGHSELLGDGSVSRNTAAGMWARLMHGLSSSKGHETRQELIAFANRYPEGGLFALEQFGKHRRVRQITVAAVLAAVGRAYYHYRDDVQLDRLVAFAEVMSTGIQKNPTDRMVIMWRELLREHKGTNSNAQAEIYGKTARSIQAYMDGIALGKIYVPSEEPFPLPDRSSAETNLPPDSMVAILTSPRTRGPNSHSVAATGR